MKILGLIPAERGSNGITRKKAKEFARKLLHPTSPLRNVKHKDDFLERILESKCNSLVSVVKVNKHPNSMFKIREDNNLIQLFSFEQTIGFQMDKISSIDIDDPEYCDLAEYFLRKTNAS